MSRLASSLIILMTTVAPAATFRAPRQVRCPLDGTHFQVRLPRSTFRPALDPALRRVSPQPVYTCPRCRWAGSATDLQSPSPISPSQASAQRAWIAVRHMVPEVLNLWALSAELAELGGIPAADVGWRYLQAAATSSGLAVHRYRGAARAAFSRAADGGSAWAAAVLSAELGEHRTARKALERAIRRADTPPALRRWARGRLEAYGGSIQKPL